MSKAIYLTNKQARVFMLLKQGLIGDFKFFSKQGVIDFIRQAGCIHFDPIDICGKNPELVLRARVEGFEKPMLDELLYKDRVLLDYFDKNLSIIQTADWPYFKRYRQAYQNNIKSLDAVNAVCGKIKDIILERGAVSSSDIGFDGAVDWYWSQTRLSRAALETMYFRGDLVIWAKKGQSNITTLPKTILTPGC